MSEYSDQTFKPDMFINTQNNGRINNIDMISNNNKFKLMDKIPVVNKFYTNSLNGIFEKSTLSMAYFSNENINIIQDNIRKGVYEKSDEQIIIDNQSVDIIVQIMRSYYLEYSLNLENDITKQIETLNNMVIKDCVENAYNEAISYVKYKRDITTMHTPIAPPIHSSKRDKTLELKNFF
jgi:hypothetical protein